MLETVLAVTFINFVMMWIWHGPPPLFTDFEPFAYEDYIVSEIEETDEKCENSQNTSPSPVQPNSQSAAVIQAKSETEVDNTQSKIDAVETSRWTFF